MCMRGRGLHLRSSHRHGNRRPLDPGRREARAGPQDRGAQPSLTLGPWGSGRSLVGTEWEDDKVLEMTVVAAAHHGERAHRP